VHLNSVFDIAQCHEFWMRPMSQPELKMRAMHLIFLVCKFVQRSSYANSVSVTSGQDSQAQCQHPLLEFRNSITQRLIVAL
jgi:hypothetical protein